MLQKVIKKLKSLSNKKNLEGMTRYGINIDNALGISIYELRKIAKEIGTNHGLALELWATKIKESRILAGYIDNPKKVTERQMESWVKDFNSWDLCDQVCSSLFDKTSFAHKKAVEWSEREEEFIKRAGFVLMAALSVHDKEAKNKDFEKFFPIISRESHDERNFVKKAVNWALRQIGKRNIALNKKAITLAKKIQTQGTKSARWIAKDALRELTNQKIQKRLKQKEKTATL